MKAIPRKTLPASEPIPDIFHEPTGAPMGHCELRLGARVVAKVFPINQETLTLRDGARIATCDWRWEVFGKDGQAIAVGQCRQCERARERCWETAEKLRKKGKV
jgi:hypothetical protein